MWVLAVACGRLLEAFVWMTLWMSRCLPLGDVLCACLCRNWLPRARAEAAEGNPGLPSRGQPCSAVDLGRPGIALLGVSTHTGQGIATRFQGLLVDICHLSLDIYFLASFFIHCHSISFLSLLQA